jgi:hypothetical protein
LIHDAVGGGVRVLIALVFALAAGVHLGAAYIDQTLTR